MKRGDHGGANWVWTTLDDTKRHARTTEHAILAVLMDIREELRAITISSDRVASRLSCYETMAIPRLLRAIKDGLKDRRCLAHPSYTGQRHPRSECPACLVLWKRGGKRRGSAK